MPENTVFIPSTERRGGGGMFIPPLLVIPFVIYNAVAFLVFGGTPAGWETTLFDVTMVSGVQWAVSAGDLMIAFAVLLLFFEILKSTHFGRVSIIEHALSTVLFVAFLVEFLLVGAAASSVFFILMLMCLVDVIGGFSVSITSARRDVAMMG